MRILPRDCKFRPPLLLYPTDAVLRGRVVRFHSYTSELGFIQQFDADDAADQDTSEGQTAAEPETTEGQPAAEQDTSEGQPAAELNLVEFGPLTEQEAAEEQLQEDWMRLLRDATTPDSGWRSQKRVWPNYKTMGLGHRCLQRAGLIGLAVPAFDFTNNVNPHQDFVDQMRCGDTSALGTDATAEAKKAIKDMLEALAADKNLTKSCKPVVIFIDEAAQAKELEYILPWALDRSTAVLIIQVGDHFQLNPTVITTREQNPFADQLLMSGFERLWRNEHPICLFNEQHHMAKGLCEISNKLTYEGRITDASSTSLQNRPLAVSAINYIQREHGVNDGNPHVFVNMQIGHSLSSNQKSNSFRANGCV